MALLDPYPGPWTTDDASHLARRAGFGATPGQFASMVSAGMDAAVDQLVDYAPADEPIDALIAALPSTTDNDRLKSPLGSAQLEGWWIYRMAHSSQPLQQQFALFLHDTLVSEYGKVSSNVTSASNNGNDGSVAGQSCTKPTGGLAPDPNRQAAIITRLLKDQHLLYCSQGHKSYRDLLLSVTRDPAMLIYLDNRLNTKGKAQENYSREVMELFSMGVGNYTEEDVREIARALTGETVDTACANNWPYTRIFNAANHDTNPKTVFGDTFNLPVAGAETEKVIDLIMARISSSGITPAHSVHPATSVYMGWKLLTWFVSEAIDIGHPAVEEMAAFFHSNTSPNGYAHDVRETLRKLFKSQFFFDSQWRFAMIKHPADFVAAALRSLGLEDTSYTSSVPTSLRSMGMRLFQPPNVAGWNHGRAWITSGNIVARFNYANRLSGTSIMTDAWVAALVTGGHVADYDDDAGLVEFFRARLLHAPLAPDEASAFAAFFAGIKGASATTSLSQFRRKARGAAHLMLTMPRYQLK